MVVPTYTDSDERLAALAQHVAKYSTVEKVEILPYHTMGEFKYKELGIPYRLEGIEPLSEERKENARNIFKKYVNVPVV